VAIERRNPLPVGRYWIDIFEFNSTAWKTWLSVAGDSVRVEVTESHPTTSQEGVDYPAREWFVFRVLRPVAWPKDAGLGLPTIADDSTSSSSDTVVRPDPEVDVTDSHPLDAALDAAGSVARSVGTAITIVAAVVAVAVVVSFGRQRAK
jgi:hypothetical protein